MPARQRRLLYNEHFSADGTLSLNTPHRMAVLSGWGQHNQPLKRTMLCVLEKVGAKSMLLFASYSLVRIQSLEAVGA